ncbi:hypothetical protein OTSANNIE_1476 [Anaplasma phagocytophilum str. Annie]|nr:hypothetical protein APHNYW_1214 [Anaplasma phagocytophilum str. ApNYW]KJV98115.1 hypothetical protein OTSANNIE_1476 [Anaplasma phagocytophilum str. Annie]
MLGCGLQLRKHIHQCFETERDLHWTIEATPSLLDSIGVTS